MGGPRLPQKVGVICRDPESLLDPKGSSGRGALFPPGRPGFLSKRGRLLRRKDGGDITALCWAGFSCPRRQALLVNCAPRQGPHLPAGIFCPAAGAMYSQGSFPRPRFRSLVGWCSTSARLFCDRSRVSRSKVRSKVRKRPQAPYLGGLRYLLSPHPRTCEGRGVLPSPTAEEAGGLRRGKWLLQGRLGITPVTPAGGGTGVRTCLAMAPEQGWTEQGAWEVCSHMDPGEPELTLWLRG